MMRKELEAGIGEAHSLFNSEFKLRKEILSSQTFR